MMGRERVAEVRELCQQGRDARDRGDYDAATNYYGLSRIKALEFVSTMGHADVNTAQRMAKECLK